MFADWLDWRNASVSHPHVDICSSGKMHFEASDGNSAQISPGSAVLLEGTAGLGHFSKVLGDKPAILAAVRLPEEHPKSESP